MRFMKEKKLLDEQTKPNALSHSYDYSYGL